MVKRQKPPPSVLGSPLSVLTSALASNVSLKTLLEMKAGWRARLAYAMETGQLEPGPIPEWPKYDLERLQGLSRSLEGGGAKARFIESLQKGVHHTKVELTTKGGVIVEFDEVSEGFPSPTLAAQVMLVVR